MALLLLFGIALCGADHLETAAVDSGPHETADHGCIADPLLRVTADGVTTGGISGAVLLAGLLLLPTLRDSRFLVPASISFHPFGEARLLTASNKLYQRHAVYRI